MTRLRITAEETRAFSVRVTDQPGALGQIAEQLGDEGINLRGYAVAGPLGSTAGRAYLVTDDPARTPAALEAAGHTVDEITAVQVTTPAHPGQLARVAMLLAQQGVNIDASFITTREDRTGLECIFAVDAPETAIAALEPMATA